MQGSTASQEVLQAMAQRSYFGAPPASIAPDPATGLRTISEEELALMFAAAAQQQIQILPAQGPSTPFTIQRVATVPIAPQPIAPRIEPHHHTNGVTTTTPMNTEKTTTAKKKANIRNSAPRVGPVIPPLVLPAPPQDFAAMSALDLPPKSPKRKRHSIGPTAFSTAMSPSELAAATQAMLAESDDGVSTKAKRQRQRKSPNQVAILEKQFSLTQHPNKQMRDALAQQLGFTPRQVQIWFQNQRQKQKHNSMHGTSAPTPVMETSKSAAERKKIARSTPASPAGPHFAPLALNLSAINNAGRSSPTPIAPAGSAFFSPRGSGTSSGMMTGRTSPTPVPIAPRPVSPLPPMVSPSSSAPTSPRLQSPLVSPPVSPRYGNALHQQLSASAHLLSQHAILQQHLAAGGQPYSPRSHYLALSQTLAGQAQLGHYQLPTQTVIAPGQGPVLYAPAPGAFMQPQNFVGAPAVPQLNLSAMKMETSFVPAPSAGEIPPLVPVHFTQASPATLSPRYASAPAPQTFMMPAALQSPQQYPQTATQQNIYVQQTPMQHLSPPSSETSSASPSSPDSNDFSSTPTNPSTPASVGMPTEVVVTEAPPLPEANIQTQPLPFGIQQTFSFPQSCQFNEQMDDLSSRLGPFTLANSGDAHQSNNNISDDSSASNNNASSNTNSAASNAFFFQVPSRQNSDDAMMGGLSGDTMMGDGEPFAIDAEIEQFLSDALNT